MTDPKPERCTDPACRWKNAHVHQGLLHETKYKLDREADQRKRDKAKK